ncbi:MAG TPA: cytochrome C [Coleofasciculaceae cyanobacterium]
MAKRVRSGIRRQKQEQLPKRRRRKPSIAVLLLLLLVWSICLGWGMAIALSNSALSATVNPNLVAQNTPAETGTVDVVPARYQLGKELYLENCGSCHVALPPEVMPTETWRRLLLEPQQHYGQQLPPLIGPVVLVMWDYLRTFSRSHVDNELIPYRVAESRYFKALHPQVDLPKPVRPGTCAICHPGATDYNYRRLTPEWE